jgi:hypothetical protein
MQHAVTSNVMSNKYVWLISALGTLASLSQAAPVVSTDRLRSFVEGARADCASKIHFDTYSFERCIDQRSLQFKKDDLARLGTDYAGFAIALSTTRVGMTGAADTARYFYWRYRPLQMKLGINDQDLCGTLPGDCTIRVAQTAAFAKTTRPPKSKKGIASDDAHGH